MGQEYLMNIVNDLEPEEFRILANRMLEKMEFKVLSSTVRKNDVEVEALRDIDGKASPFIIRVKRGHADAGPEDIQNIVGRKRDGTDMRSIFISTSRFSKDAHKYADLLGVSIADGEKFGLLLKELDLDSDLKKQETRKVVQQEGERFLPSIDELENQMRWGNDFFNSGNYRKAIEYYDNALRLKPSYDLAWNMKGHVLSAMQRYEEAAECFRKAIDINAESEEAWYNLGTVYYNLGRYDEEIQCYDRALEENPQFIKAWNNKGATLHEMGKYEEAVLCYDKILYLDPKNINVLNNKGVALKYMEKYDEALDAFDQATMQKDDYRDAWLNKALLLHEMGQYDGAVMCYDKVLDMEKSPEIYYQKGIALMAAENPRKAIGAFESAILLKPHWQLAIDEKEKAEQALKDMDETRLRELEEKRLREEEEKLAHLKAEEERRALEEKARLEELARQERKKAEEQALLEREMEEAIEDKPAKPEISERGLHDDFESIMKSDEMGKPLDERNLCSSCGTALNEGARFCSKCGTEVELPDIELGELEVPPEPAMTVGEPPELEAVEEKRAIEAELEEELALQERGRLLIRMMKYDEALDCINRSLEIDETTGLVLEKANLLFLMGRYDDALEFYDKVLKKEPDNVPAMMNQVSSLMKIGEYEEALAVNYKLIQLEDEEPVIWIERGNILLNLNEVSKAVECFDRAIELAPELSEVWNAEGAALLQIDRHDDAVLCFDRAIQIDPEFAEAWCNKGCAVLASGEPGKSIKYFDRAIDIDQDDDRAWASKAAALYEMERFDESISCFDRALSIKDSEFMLNNKGFVQLSNDMLDEAIDTFDKAIKLNEEYPEAWNNKGLALSRKEDYVNALECFERALGIAPDFRDALRNRDATVRRLEQQTSGAPEEPPEGPEPEEESGIKTAEELEDMTIASEEFRCPSCNAVGNIDDEFCDKCGAKFTEEEKEDGVVEELDDLLTPAKKEEEKKIDKHEKLTRENFVKELVRVPGLGFSKSEAIYDAGFTTYASLEEASVKELAEVKGISERLAKNIKKVYK